MSTEEQKSLTYFKPIMSAFILGLATFFQYTVPNVLVEYFIIGFSVLHLLVGCVALTYIFHRPALDKWRSEIKPFGWFKTIFQISIVNAITGIFLATQLKFSFSGSAIFYASVLMYIAIIKLQRCPMPETRESIMAKHKNEYLIKTDLFKDEN
mgnify:CR=1 FL=1